MARFEAVVVLPSSGLMALLRHTYGTYLIDKDLRAREFDVIARLAAAVPVYELRLGTALEAVTGRSERLAEWLFARGAATAETATETAAGESHDASHGR